MQDTRNTKKKKMSNGTDVSEIPSIRGHRCTHSIIGRLT